VTRSILDLSSAATQVRNTKDFALRARKTSSDELGELVDAFNEMLTTIQARDAHLEAQVAQRTEELRRTLQELWSEMDLARKIQTVLLPEQPQLPHFDVGAQMVPAASVGGDYYDVLLVGDVAWVLIGDVAGHGVTAGLTMMIVQTAVHTVITSAGDRAHLLTPKQLLSQVNAAVRGNMQKIGEEQYMTIMALRIERGEVRFAGLHQDILVYRAAAARVERIESRGLWLGLLDDISELLDDDSFQLAEGDVFMLYTDGVTESAGSVDGPLLGTDGLGARLKELAVGNTSSADIVRGVVEYACRTTPEDDVTVLAARYLPREEQSV
jgi:histidine kinase